MISNVQRRICLGKIKARVTDYMELKAVSSYRHIWASGSVQVKLVHSHVDKQGLTCLTQIEKMSTEANCTQQLGLYRGLNISIQTFC